MRWSKSRSRWSRAHAASTEGAQPFCRCRDYTGAGIQSPGVGVKIGVVKEIKPQEARVALTPAGARELVARGHDVVVETGAGTGSAFLDDAYVSAGASLASSEDVWN